MLVEYQVANFGPYKQSISLNMKSTEDDSFCARIPRSLFRRLKLQPRHPVNDHPRKHRKMRPVVYL